MIAGSTSTHPREVGGDAAGPIRLSVLLASREIRWATLAEAAAAAFTAILAAQYVAAGTPDATGPDLLMSLLRRFDVTLLLVCALLLTLRIAIREEEDRRDGWLEPVFAAGAPRWRYGLALAAGTAGATAITFAVGAVTFAVALQTFTDSSELLALLPRTLGTGLLQLGTYAVLTATLALVIRSVPAVLIIVATLTLAPLLLIMRFLINDTLPPGWVLILSRLSPLVPRQPETADVLRALLYIFVGACIAGLMSGRVAGRRP